MREENSPSDGSPFPQKQTRTLLPPQTTGSGKAHTHLVDDVDAVVKLLPLQEGMQVFQQVDQVLLSVPVGNEDGHPLQRLTFLRMIPASGHFGVFGLYFLQSEVWLKDELALASCNQHQTHVVIGAVARSSGVYTADSDESLALCLVPCE